MPRVRQKFSQKAGITHLPDLPTKTPYADRPSAIAREMPEVVYVVTTRDGLIKIGHTTGLATRLNGLGCRWADLMLVIQADRSYEMSLHRRFKQHRARGREFYRPNDDILGWVNSERELLGLSEIAA